jgi:competence protein ComEA
MSHPLRHTLTLTLLATTLLLAAPADAKPAQNAPGKATAQAAPSAGTVNINTASEEQLRLLPRIGPTKAKRIVAYRTRQKFRNPWDLTRVKGIGRKTFRRLRPFVTVNGETTLTSRPKLDKEG